MIVIVGESACGKSTLQKNFITKHPEFSKIVTYTTRPPRPGEQDGVDYHYVTDERFNELKKKHFFAETNSYRGWQYGTPIDECMERYKIAVLTPAGMRALRFKGVPIITVYLRVDRRSRLIKSLQRGDDIEEAYRRNLSDVGQFDAISKEVQYIIPNDNFENDEENLVACLESIVGNEIEDVVPRVPVTSDESYMQYKLEGF